MKEPVSFERPKETQVSEKELIPTTPSKPKSLDDDFGFDVEDLVKKIDAKIAQLEEEERKNKEAQEKAEKEKTEVKPIDSLQALSTEKAPETEAVQMPALDWDILPFNTPSTVSPSQPTTKPTIDLNDGGDDDDFFDDFFDN